MTPTLVPGSRRGQDRTSKPACEGGFTLIELLVVVAMVAIATALVSLTLPDPGATRLERESERLIALFESARAEARVSGLAVRWVPQTNPDRDPEAAHFLFQGLPARLAMPTRWLGEPPIVEVFGARVVTLGPEPMIGAQRLSLRIDKQDLTLETDGLGPFEIKRTDGAPP